MDTMCTVHPWYADTTQQCYAGALPACPQSELNVNRALPVRSVRFFLTLSPNPFQCTPTSR
eukprot:5483364-Pleurochrysis_carterae.AAC.1